jgi:5'-nucleotidase
VVRILIANDDGIYSPGILALARAASRFGAVLLAAPDVEQSSMSHAITHSRPLSWRRTPVDGFDAFRVNGTPADCVALGVHLADEVDLVLSGINLGYNIGNSMWHSGTLAAAKQAALLGRRGIALSTTTDGGEPDFEALAPWVVEVLGVLIPETSIQLLNVNLPPRPVGLSWTRQSVRHYDGRVVAGKDPTGRPYYWLTVRPIDHVDQGTDRWAVRHHLVSITPLRLDLTDHDALAAVRQRHPLSGPRGATPDPPPPPARRDGG